MKRILNIILLLFCCSLSFAQAKEDIESNKNESEDPCIVHEQKTNSWRITPELGNRYKTALDTTFLNYYRTDIEDYFTTSYNYLGNFGSPGESRIFLDQISTPDFLFMKAYERFNVSPGKMTFYNTQIPYTQVSYLTGGSKQNAEDRFMLTFAGNINKKWGFGANLDYIYARGYYNFQGVNTLDWQAYAYYMGDRYQVQAYTNIAQFGNQENGGIQDVDYILKPENVNENLTDPKNIPTNLINAWNRTKERDVYLTQRYNLGFEKSYYKDEEDSTEYTNFIPVTSFVHTFHFQTNKRKFVIDKNGIVTKDFFENTYLNDVMTDDSVSYQTIKNTLGITLNEGFNKYAKFGLGAFATLENRKYTNMLDSADINFIDRDFKTNILWVGGELSKQQGSILTYQANARFALSGYNLGDVDITGRIQTKIPLWGDSVIIRANGYFKNTEPAYHFKHYVSNHFKWSESFDKEQRLRVMGEIYIPYSRTVLSAGFENVTNYLYFNNKGLPSQNSGNIQVLHAALKQNIKWGILNWNNALDLQKSSNETVLPLPTFSAYSQLYINFKIARVLETQLGTEGYYYTRYYSPLYQPATQMFHTQDIAKTGNYPILNVFANFKLKKARFYVMMYHVNKGLFGSNDYFLAPFYPNNPRVFKFGVSVDFSN